MNPSAERRLPPPSGRGFAVTPVEIMISRNSKPPAGEEAARAHAWCRRLVKAEARNFYYGFLLLPARKRQAIHALYAFCRILDNAVDLPSAGPADRTGLRDRFSRVISGRAPLGRRDRLASIALREAAREFPISGRQLNWIMDGVLMDCDVTRYRTMEDLRRYLFGVASAVGLACLEVFRYRHPAARSYAVYLGYAMQLTNIIRDVKEDYALGRIYLPQEDLERFGVREEDLGRSETTPALRRLLAFEAGRARDFYAKAQKLWPLLGRDAAPCPYALSLIYRALLALMARNDFRVLEGRFSLPRWRKALCMIEARCAFLC